jgi:hypothetical protein
MSWGDFIMSLKQFCERLKDELLWFWPGKIFLGVIFGIIGYAVYRAIVDFLL